MEDGLLKVRYNGWDGFDGQSGHIFHNQKFSHIAADGRWRRRRRTARHARRGKLLAEGYIALQAETAAVDFRKVELLNLVGCADQEASNYRDYVVKPDPESCRYP